MKAHWHRKFGAGVVVEPQRNSLILPAFTLSVPTWAGASSLLALYDINNPTFELSLKLPITEFGAAFVPAVRWVADGIVYRFKLWDAGVLYFPVYNGERIGVNAKFEIWSVNSASAPELDEDISLVTSLFETPAACKCALPTTQDILLTASVVPDPLPPDTYCNPFCENLSTLCNS